MACEIPCLDYCVDMLAIWSLYNESNQYSYGIEDNVHCCICRTYL